MNLVLNTAKLLMFVLVDSNGTEVTGLGTNFTVTISKNGGAFAASTGAKAEIGNGWYSYTLAAAEADTLGALAIKVTGAGVVQQNLLYDVVGSVIDEIVPAIPDQPPHIMTDAYFTTYGGMTGSSTYAQRQAAYAIAEELAVADMGTFLVPTMVTGTYDLTGEIWLEHSYVNRAVMAWVRSFDGTVQQTFSGSNYMRVRDREHGILDISNVYRLCCYGYYDPLYIDIVYEASLPIPVAYGANMLLALTTLAQIELNEIIGYGNESPGDGGIEQFSNQDYSEKRVAQFKTSMGSSNKALYAHKLLSKYRRPNRVGLGRPIR